MRFSLIVFLIVVNSGYSQIIIPKPYRVPNTEPGCCVPSVTEAISQYQGYSQLKGFKDQRYALPYSNTVSIPGCKPYQSHPCGMSQKELRQVLDNKGIAYTVRPIGAYNVSHVHDAIKSGNPVLVTTGNKWDKCDLSHYQAIVGITKSQVQLYDPNHTNKPYVTMSASKFGQAWYGNSLVIKRQK